MEKIPFSRVCFSDIEEHEVIQCLRSGWITTGPRVAEFEKAYAEFVGCPEALAVSCGTAALHLALWTMDLKPGDEVITPSLTWVSVPNLVKILGAKPVFCEVDPATFNIDPGNLEEIITSKTRAIVPVHFAGRPVNLDEIHSIANAYDIYVIEDACHAIGAAYKNSRIGSHSGLCAFSFHPNKNMTTAEGGMLTGNDTDRLKRARLLRFHGVSRDTFKRIGSDQLPHYEAVFPGLKLNMTDLEASLGIHQLKKVIDFNRQRSQAVAWYVERLKPIQNRLLIPPDCKGMGTIHSWHLFNICVEDKPNLRENLMQRLLDNKIQTGLHYLPVHLMPSMHEYRPSRPLLITEKIGRTIMSLPLFPGITENQIDRVVDVIYNELT